MYENRKSALILIFLIFFVLTYGDDWNQWRGPNRDGHSSADAYIPQRLPQNMKPLWSIQTGGGFSSPVVSGKVLVYLDEQNNQETAHCIEAQTGRELWQKSYGESFGDEWGSGPRSTPIIDGDRVYVQSCRGEFRCLSLSDGSTIWGFSFEKDFGVKFLGSKAKEGTASRRGNNGCGVVHKNKIIVPVGSTNGATIVCFDKLNGKMLWKAGNDETAYSSLMVANFDGVWQVVAFTADNLMGVDLENGKILWSLPLKTAAKRHAATPVIIGDAVAVNSHTFGIVCIKPRKDGDVFKPVTVWSNPRLKINLSTPTLCGNYLYSQGASKDFVCIESRTGELKWSQPGFGSGTKDNCSVIAAGDKILVLAEDGQLVLLEQNPEKYVELGRVQVCGNTWSHPAYSNGRLYVRDNRELRCYLLKK